MERNGALGCALAAAAVSIVAPAVREIDAAVAAPNAEPKNSRLLKLFKLLPPKPWPAVNSYLGEKYNAVSNFANVLPPASR
jgi:hypothetical protein